VCALCETAAIAHVRVLNAIRVAPEDLAAFVRDPRNGTQRERSARDLTGAVYGRPIMTDEASFSQLESHWLTRAEAARYVGLSGESALRAAEAKGLLGVRDPDGQVWHTPEALDVWTWRGKPPTAAQKARVLRGHAKARGQEARVRERKEELAAERRQAIRDAEVARWTAE
jgi:hypothetical protein